MSSAFTKKKKVKTGSGGESRKCKWCGRPSHPEGKSLELVNCPAREMTCFRCNEKGHVARCCEKPDYEAADVKEATNPLEDPPVEASVSFGFAAGEDFRWAGKRNGKSMREARKWRQRKLRAMENAKRSWQATTSADKAFGTALHSARGKGNPCPSSTFTSTGS